MEDLSENFFENHRKSDRICVIVCVYLSLENNFLEVYHAYRTMENNGDRILEKFPLVEKMLVPTTELAEKKDKVKTTGNVYNKYYSDLKAAALAYAEQEV